jgi:purine-nucleoside phosphorylase
MYLWFLISVNVAVNVINRQLYRITGKYKKSALALLFISLGLASVFIRGLVFIMLYKTKTLT